MSFLWRGLIKMEDICKRCGLCCFLIIDEKPTDKPCPFLQIYEDGTTHCKVYRRNRVRRKIGKDGKRKLICTMRINSPFDYEGCPYNTNKPIVKIGSDGKHYLEVENGNNNK